MAAVNGCIRQKYKDACNEFQVGPISRVIKEVETEEINLSHHGLGLKETQALTKALPVRINFLYNFSTIARLILKDNCLSSECIALISNTITALPTLTFLDMSDNVICPMGGASIAAMLKDNAHLRTLNLANNKMGDNTAISIMDSLKGTAVHSLDISGNKLSEECGTALAHLIRDNETLQELNVSFNALANRGAVAFLAALQSNEYLRKLDISWNGLANDGAEALSKALRTNTALIKLNIASNRISDDGMKYVADMLTENKKLAKFQLFLNPFGCTGFAYLLEALLKVPDSPLKMLKLTELYLDDRIEVLLSRMINARPRLELQFLRQKLQFNLACQCSSDIPEESGSPTRPEDETLVHAPPQTPNDEPPPVTDSQESQLVDQMQTQSST